MPITSTRFRKLVSIDSIAISQEIPRCAVKRKGFDEPPRIDVEDWNSGSEAGMGRPPL
jgi:hypothetical protein